jgi:TonB family protein
MMVAAVLCGWTAAAEASWAAVRQTASAPSDGSPPLRVLAEVDGQWLPLWGTERGWPVAIDGETLVRLLPDTPLRIEGELAEAFGWWQWPATSFIDRDSTPEERWFLRALRESNRKRDPSNTSGQRSRWEDAEGAPAAEVMMWVVAGQVTKARLMGLNRPSAGSEYGAMVLPADELHGRAAVLQVRNGRLVRALGEWGEPGKDRLLDRLVLGEDEGVAADFLPEHVRAVSPAGLRWLDYAALCGSEVAVRRLVELGARVNPPDAVETPPLHHAVRGGRTQVVRTLLELKANVNRLGLRRTTALHLATEAGHEEIVGQLLGARAATNVVDANGQTPVTLAIDHNRATILEMLVAHRARLNFRDPQMSRVLITKAAEGHAEIVRLALRRGTSPHIEHRGGTPLIAAADRGHTEIAEMLLAAKAPVDHLNADGYTALMAAVRRGHVETARALIAAGSDVNRANAQGGTPLHFAVVSDSGAAARLLLAHGANLEAANATGLTPLMLAVMLGARETTAALLEAGAKLNPLHPLFELVIEGALVMDQPAVLQRAVEAGWSPASRLADRWPVRRVARLMRARACHAWLKENGAPDEDEDGGPVFAAATELDARLRPARLVLPDDPRPVSSRHDEAKVELTLVVDEAGRVLFPNVVHSEEQELKMPALEAVRRWQFEPPLRAGEPVAVLARLPLAFPDYRARVLDHELVDRSPVPVKQVAPEYPRKLAEAGVQGRVELQFTVGRDGKVRNVRVRSSSNPDFEDPAMAAIAQWEFEPGEIDGEPVDVEMQLPLRFTIGTPR